MQYMTQGIKAPRGVATPRQQLKQAPGAKGGVVQAQGVRGRKDLGQQTMASRKSQGIVPVQTVEYGLPQAGLPPQTSAQQAMVNTAGPGLLQQIGQRDR